MAHAGGRPTDYTFEAELLALIPFEHEVYECKRVGDTLHIKTKASRFLQEWHKEHLEKAAELEKEYGAL